MAWIWLVGGLIAAAFAGSLLEKFWEGLKKFFKATVSAVRVVFQGMKALFRASKAFIKVLYAGVQEIVESYGQHSNGQWVKRVETTEVPASEVPDEIRQMGMGTHDVTNELAH